MSRVTNPDSGNATLNGGFTYEAVVPVPPAINAITPDSGPSRRR